jgi:hypothetical protein
VKPGWTRVSFPYYMGEEDFEFILAAIEFIAIYGQRFLSLYNFDLKNGSWKIKKQKLDILINENKLYMRETREKANNDYFKARSDSVGIKQVGALRRKSFLEAKCIASRLPKFLSERIHPNVDPSVLHFVV